MDTQAKLVAALEAAQGRNPLEYPYGFYLEDHFDETAGGSFFWYATADELLQVLQTDLIDALSDADLISRELVKAEIIKLLPDIDAISMDDEGLLSDLNDLLAEIQFHIQFMGSFKSLCKNKTEWSRYLREEFREDYLEDIDDLSEKKLQSSIKHDDQADFAEFVADYLI